MNLVVNPLSLISSKKLQAGTKPDGIPLQQYSRNGSLAVPASDSDSASDYEYMPEDGLLRNHAKSHRSVTASFDHGPLGNFFFGTSTGHSVYVSILIAMLFGVECATVVTNRLVLITGVWRFSYPITITFAQVLVTHVVLMISAPLTRIVLRRPLELIGLPVLIAPPRRTASTARNVLGMGMVDISTAGLVRILPLAFVFVAKVLLSNLAFAYTPLPTYTLTKLPTLPLILLLTPFVLVPHITYSKSLISTSIASLLGLLTTCVLQRTSRAPIDTLITGLLSSLFSALYPLYLLRLLDTTSSTTSNNDYTNHHDRVHIHTRPPHKLYSTLTHLAPLSTTLLLPILLLSGELPDIQRNCYILDVPKFWIPIVGGVFASFGQFVLTALLADAAGPVALPVVGLARAGVLMIKLLGNGGVVLGWVIWGTGVLGAGSCLIRGREWR